MASPGYQQIGRLSKAKSREYSLVSSYKLTYRNREDITNLPPGVLIVGSKNVLSNVSERLGIRQGYALDGDVSSVLAGIGSSFDWQTRGNGEKHLRAGFLTQPTVTITIASPAVFTTPSAHGYSAGRQISFSTTGTLPTGLTVGTTYYVLSTGLTSTQFQVSATYGGTAITTTGTQTGTHTVQDGLLQYRYVDSAGVVTWRDLLGGLDNVGINYTSYWNTTESLRECLFVNGKSQIQAWNGAVTTILSGAPSTLTKTGTDSWLDAGFYASTSGRSLVINGVTYTYTGGENTTTLTGVTPDPTLIPANSVAHQSIVTTPNSSMTGITSTFKNGLIRSLNNQVFVGSLTSSVLWISKVNSYTDYTSSTPRQTGEGASLILDDNLVALEPQESYMYVSAGKDRWYNVNFQVQTSTVGVTYEQVNAQPLKTGKMQGAQSQACVSHMKNDIITVTNEPTIDTFGRVESSLATPQTTNISDPIKLDIDAYDFTNASIYYHRYKIYVAIPANEIVIIYSLTTKSWEAPQELPISRFYTVDGELYGHSCLTSESYKLFTGYADRVYPGFSGHPINMVMRFSYENYGSRYTYKKCTSMYLEGYINENTVATVALTYELDGCATTITKEINGSDKQIVCISTPAGSLGKVSLGKSKLGGDGSESLTDLPPKFRVEKTFQNNNFFECSLSIQILGTDNRFELLAFGLATSPASEEPITIRQ